MKNFVKYTFVLAITAMIFSACHRPGTYIVSFDANGGAGRMRSQVFDEGESQALFQNAYTRDNHTFTGWNTNQNGSGTAYTDGQTITISSDMILYAQWTANGSQGSGSQGGSSQGGSNIPASGQLNGHEWVNLGLPSGTLWATCNVGATNPEDYGDFFAWGETTTKETYNWDNYRYCYNYNGVFYITKYCYSPNMGYPEHFTDSLGILEASDDAATANWGSGWRTPTLRDFEELASNCTKKYWTQNWIPGTLLTSRSNGNTIFLPYTESNIENCYNDFYMSSTVSSDYAKKYHGCDIRTILNSFNGYIKYGQRCYGCPVRPVCTSSQK